MEAKDQEKRLPHETRRRLLQLGLYAAPAVVATLVARDASAVPGPCGPNPLKCSCGPNGKGTSSCP